MCAVHKYVYVLSLLIIVLICEKCSAKAISTLTMNRITSELRDIVAQKLTTDIPFNETNDECGIRLSPIKSKLLEWHFSFTGIEGTQYEGGVYHGVIKLHQDYPRKAPSVFMCTPSGRWEVNTEICLSASSFHQETWDPNWNLRTLVLSLRGFMISRPGEVGSIRTPVEHQVLLARQSREWRCPQCGVQHSDLLLRTVDRGSVESGLDTDSPSIRGKNSAMRRLTQRNAATRNTDHSDGDGRAQSTVDVESVASPVDDSENEGVLEQPQQGGNVIDNRKKKFIKWSSVVAASTASLLQLLW